MNIKAPLLIALGLCLLGWAYQNAGGFGPILSQPSAFDPGQPKAGQFCSFFFPALTGMIGFWATLSLNIPDFSRYARSQRDQVIGQALGLAADDGAVFVHRRGGDFRDDDHLRRNNLGSGGCADAFPESDRARRRDDRALHRHTRDEHRGERRQSGERFRASLARKISFRIGGLITGIIGVLMMPWKLVADPSGYIFTWLVGYSALLGPIGGIMIADYFVIRRRQLNVAALYRADGEYRYTNGFSLVALFALDRRGAAESSRISRHGEVLDRDRVPRFSCGSTITRGSLASRSLSLFISLCAVSADGAFHPNDILQTLPPFDHQPQPYTGPSADEVLRCASNS